MPYSDPVRRRSYQSLWIASRRAHYLSDKACVDCGVTEDLELDHVRGEKVDHRFWSWSEERREAELAKCEVRCADCHQARHAAGRVRHGIKRYEKGCRCEICRAAKSEANRRHRQRQRPGPDSNWRERLCRPLDNRSPTRPEVLEGYAMVEGTEA